MSNFASGYIKYINHLEQINDAALLNPQVMIDEVEDSYHEHIENIARNIVTHYKTAKVCMLAGPSSSGKTTTAHLLQRELGKLGVHAEIVSLDDFYLGPDETPVLPNGEKDYETVDALDIALIQFEFRHSQRLLPFAGVRFYNEDPNIGGKKARCQRPRVRYHGGFARAEPHFYAWSAGGQHHKAVCQREAADQGHQRRGHFADGYSPCAPHLA